VPYLAFFEDRLEVFVEERQVHYLRKAEKSMGDCQRMVALADLPFL
jgi:hypothetical protein